MQPLLLFKGVKLHDGAIINIEHFPDRATLTMRMELSRFMQLDYDPAQPDDPLRGWMYFNQVKDLESEPPLATIDWTSIDGEALGIYPEPERNQEELQAFQLLMSMFTYTTEPRPFYVVRFLCGDVQWLPDSDDPGGATLLQVLNIVLQYREQGVLTGDELMFTPAAAVSLLDDMQKIEVRCLGTSGGYGYDIDPSRLMWDVSAEFSPSPIHMEMNKQNTTDAVLAFVQNRLPARTLYVAPYFSYPAAWNPILHAVWRLIPGPTDPFGKAAPAPSDTSAPGDTRRFVQVLIAYLQYLDQAILVDDDLLFEPGTAQALVADMARVGVASSRAAGWSMSLDNNTWVQIVGEALIIPPNVDGVQQSADAVSQFLARLPELDTHVSVRFDLPDAWSAVICQVWQQIHGQKQ